MPTSARKLRSRHRIAGLIVIVASGLIALYGFLPWMVISNQGSADSTLSGWGLIGGVDGVDATNINEVIAGLDGSGSYRPALFPTILAVLAVAGAVRLLFAASKVAAAAVATCGVIVVAYGIFRVVSPGDVAGILNAGESRAGIAPWLTLVSGVFILAAAVLVLAGKYEAQRPMVSRGVQPRR